VAFVKVPSKHLSVGTDENQESFKSVTLLSWPKLIRTSTEYNSISSQLEPLAVLCRSESSNCPDNQIYFTRIWKAKRLYCLNRCHIF
jgi:hypothetical protein